jgi:phosphohistidine phosphatase SixA
MPHTTALPRLRAASRLGAPRPAAPAALPRPARLGTLAAALAAGLLAAALPAGAAGAQAAGRPAARPVAAPGAQPALVLVVRHAEKAAAPADDPPLSPEGEARARALAEALATADVGAVVVTPRRRTAATAAPLAAARGLIPEVVPFGPPGAAGVDAHARAVADAARRHPGRVVLVVGHSNTVPAIVGALGGPRLPDLCDASYATLFVVRPAPPAAGGAPAAPAAVVRAQYGRPDPADAAACAAPPAAR